MFENIQLPPGHPLDLNVFDTLVAGIPGGHIHQIYSAGKRSFREQCTAYLFGFCMRYSGLDRVGVFLYDQNCFGGIFTRGGSYMPGHRRKIWDYV